MKTNLIKITNHSLSQSIDYLNLQTDNYSPFKKMPYSLTNTNREQFRVKNDI